VAAAALAGAAPADEADWKASYAVFACAWALAALFHFEFRQLVWDEAAWAPKLTAALTAAAALVTLRRPADPRALAALALAQLVDVAVVLPEVPNHWMLAALVNLAWLLVIVHASRAGGRFPSDGGRLLDAARDPLLVGVALFYLWTGFWKLNRDFVRPEVSCAVVSWDNLLMLFRWLPDAEVLRHAVIWITLGVELGAPVLLLVPRTRRLGVLLLVVFHTLLGLDAMKRFVNFSSVMFALLLLYLAPAALGRVRTARAVAPVGRVASLVYGALLAIGLLAGPRVPLYWLGRWVLWVVYATLLLGWVVLPAVRAPVAERAPLHRRGAAVAWLFPVLVMLNGLSPIVGLKNRTSWQMYSNLRLEADASNHWLVGPSLDVFGALADRVVVVATTAKRLEPWVGPDVALPWIEFRRLAAAEPEASVTYERGGARVVVPRVGDAPALAAPSLLVRKTMFFRALGPKVVESCVW
jgi:hypothetical protein